MGGTVGQTFLATASDFVLTSVTFEINNPLSQAVNLTAFVYAFQYSQDILGAHYSTDSQGTVVGAAIFTSPVLSIPPSITSQVFDAVTFPIGAAVLVPGQEYIALVSTGVMFPNVIVGSSFGPGGTLLYPDGEEVTGIPVSNPPTNQGTIFYDQNTDTAFALTFGDAVPEPGSVTLFISGLTVLLSFVWKRRSATCRGCAK